MIHRSPQRSRFPSTDPPGLQWLWQARSRTSFPLPVVVNSTSYAFNQPVIIEPALVLPLTFSAAPLPEPSLWTSQVDTLRGPFVVTPAATWPCASHRHDASCGGLRNARPCLDWARASGGTAPLLHQFFFAVWSWPSIAYVKSPRRANV